MNAKPTDMGKNLQKMLKESRDLAKALEEKIDSSEALQKPVTEQSQQISRHSNA